MKCSPHKQELPIFCQNYPNSTSFMHRRFCTSNLTSLYYFSVLLCTKDRKNAKTASLSIQATQCGRYLGCQPKSRVPKILLYNHPWTKREQNGTHTKVNLSIILETLSQNTSFLFYRSFMYLVSIVFQELLFHSIMQRRAVDSAHSA